MDERTRRFGAGLCAVRTAACLRRRPKAGGGAICTQGGPGGRPQGGGVSAEGPAGAGRGGPELGAGGRVRGGLEGRQGCDPRASGPAGVCIFCIFCEERGDLIKRYGPRETVQCLLHFNSWLPGSWSHLPLRCWGTLGGGQPEASPGWGRGVAGGGRAEAEGTLFLFCATNKDLEAGGGWGGGGGAWPPARGAVCPQAHPLRLRAPLTGSTLAHSGSPGPAAPSAQEMGFFWRKTISQLREFGNSFH